MNADSFKEGSAEHFDRNWRARKETLYGHWTRGRPQNQIQFAFRQHWLLFQEIIGTDVSGRRCLELGCGRGSISAYFADAGYNCTLLDISPTVLEVAGNIFEYHDLPAHLVVGDVVALPYRAGEFDVVVSIGLMEHFVEVDTLFSEQARVLAPKGLLVAYIVPSLPDNVQKYWRWLNQILAFGAFVGRSLNRRNAMPVAKRQVYRSDALSQTYVEALKKLPVYDIHASGVYPLPMISHSPEFPFTLLPPILERCLAQVFGWCIGARRSRYRRNPWLCEESYGQAILVWCRKGHRIA